MGRPRGFWFSFYFSIFSLLLLIYFDIYAYTHRIWSLAWLISGLYIFPFFLFTALTMVRTFFKKETAFPWSTSLSLFSQSTEEVRSQLGPVGRSLSFIILRMGQILHRPPNTIVRFLGINLDAVGWRNLEVAWTFCVFGYSFYLASAGHPYIAIVLSAIPVLLVLELSGAILLHKGWGKIVYTVGKSDDVARYDIRVVRIGDILIRCSVVVLGFAGMHFGLSSAISSAYNTRLEWFDSIYFSVITLGTVGYGDIYPKSVSAKALCIAEVSSGIVLLILFINIGMANWLEDHRQPVLGTDLGIGGVSKRNDNG